MRIKVESVVTKYIDMNDDRKMMSHMGIHDDFRAR